MEVILDYQSKQFLSIAEARGWVTQRQANLIENTSVPFSGCIDRTTSLDTGVPVPPIDPVPQFEHKFTKTLEEVGILRAEELNDQICGFHRMHVLWSGGIDSTFMLVSLIRADIPRHNIVVLLTHSSISEYPWFYENVIKPNFEVRMLAPSVFPDLRENELMVTGELGDQMNGSLLIDGYEFEEGHSYEQCLTEPWQNHIKYFMGDSKELVEDFEPLVARCPFKITRIFDFLWWVNFTCKWQHVLFRITNHSKEPLRIFNNTYPFYQSWEFQQWSMHPDNQHLKTGATHASYKRGFKESIEEFTHDADYTKHKLKIGSLPVKFNRQRFIFLLATGERVSVGIKSLDPVAFEKRYGSRFDSLFLKQRSAA